jgi:hypothetical protein
MGGYFELLPSFIYTPGRAHDLIWADYDNDGDNDVFLTTFNSGQCRLFENIGNMVFQEVTLQAGLAGMTLTNYGASFGDYDKDGDLDLYLCRYSLTGNPADPLQTNALFQNNGNGTFTNVSVQAGVTNGIAASFQGIWLDYDDDGWPDLYVINDRHLFINTLYRNNGDGTFTDVTSITNTAMDNPNGSGNDDPMSATFADFDNDGDMDIYSSNTGHLTRRGRLLVAQSNLVFTEEGQARGVDIAHWSWGATFIDTDNDTWQDLYVTTGRMQNDILTEVRSYLYINNEGQDFTDSPQLFSNSNHIAPSYSVAKGDINNDGYADMVVTNAKGIKSYLWLNSATSANNYIKVTLEGTLSNRMAIGSWIRVYIDTNVYTYYTRCGENYCSQNSQHHIFGLGEYESVDSIVVSYLSGITDVYYNLDVNEHYYFVEGETLVFDLDSYSDTVICESDSVVLSAPEFESYLWNNGSTTQSIVVSETGTYFLQAQNELGHTYTSDTISVWVMNEVYLDPEVQDVLCFGDSTGAVVLNVFNETDNYQVNWSNGYSGIQQSGLGAGNYTYVYSDEFGCTFNGSVDISEAAEILLFSETSNQTTFESGSLQIMAIGGTPPIQILVNGTAMPTNPMDVDSGVYMVTVSDANGCIYEEAITIGFVDMSSVFQFDLNNLNFYPNPLSESVLHLKGITSEHVVDIRDALGRQVQYSNCVSNTCLEFINISAGAILITVRVEDYIYVFKVIVLE